MDWNSAIATNVGCDGPPRSERSSVRCPLWPKAAFEPDHTLSCGLDIRKRSAKTVTMSGQNRRRLVWTGLALVGLLLIGIGTFALPIRTWRTGELERAEFPTIRSDAATPERLWIDTDPTCGHGRRSDPDDCFALFTLARSDAVEIAGVSTVFGNAELDVTHAIARDVQARLAAAGHPLPPIFRGARASSEATSPASAALASALEAGPLTILALGPLTNVADTLRSQPSLAPRVERIIAVMGRHPGHLFHPSEGRGDGVLFGHGPVFSDLNFRRDPRAVDFLLSMNVPLTLIPYEAARDTMVTPSDLERIAATGSVGSWIVQSAAGWLDYWQDEVGLSGFYPFDLVAAWYVLRPEVFQCGRGMATVDFGWAPGWLWVLDDAGLFVRPAGSANTGSSVNYCPTFEKADDFPGLRGEDAYPSTRVR